MATRTLEANGHQYLFSPDEQPPFANRLWALVKARLINDVTGQPVGGEISLETDLQHSKPRIARDGLVGLVATPREVFPILAARNFTVTITIHVTGYIPRTITLVIPNDQKLTVGPTLPVRGDRVIRLNNTTNLLVREMLMVGNPVTNPGTHFEEVQIVGLGPGPSQVTIKPGLAWHHNVTPEPCIPVIPSNFGPADAGDVFLVPQP